jgi:hypothetical protein
MGQSCSLVAQRSDPINGLFGFHATISNHVSDIASARAGNPPSI